MIQVFLHNARRIVHLGQHTKPLRPTNDLVAGNSSDDTYQVEPLRRCFTNRILASCRGEWTWKAAAIPSLLDLVSG